MSLKILVTLALLFPIFSATAAGKAESLDKKPGLNIATFNVRNYGADEEKGLLATNNKVLKELLDRTNSDLLAVQEIVDDSAFKKFVAQNFPKHKVTLSRCGGKGRQKLGFIYNASRLSLSKVVEDNRIKEKKACNDGLRPVLVANFKDKESDVQFVAMAIHLKAGGQPENIEARHNQIRKLTGLIRDYKRQGNDKLIILGDFNTTQYIEGDRYYRAFVDFVDSNKLIDFSASLSCTSYWWGGVDDGLMYGSLLDHILVTEAMWDNYRVQEVEVQAHCKRAACRQRSEESLGSSYNEVSDHCPVVASFR